MTKELIVPATNDTYGVYRNKADGSKVVAIQYAGDYCLPDHTPAWEGIRCRGIVIFSMMARIQVDSSDWVIYHVGPCDDVVISALDHETFIEEYELVQLEALTPGDVFYEEKDD